MKILLVEPDYKRTIIPVGLAKMSTYFKLAGHEVRFARGQTYIGDGVDEIYITSMFTWDLPTVRDTVAYYKTIYPNAQIEVGGVAVSIVPEMLKEMEVHIHVGILPDVDKCKPDYSFFPEIDYSIGHTSRGCLRRCDFCRVGVLEPEYVEYPEWYKMLDPSKKKIVLLDNNFLGTSENHFNSVVTKLRIYKKEVDFNTGLDCRLLSEEKARMLRGVRMPVVRMAFDSMGIDGIIQPAVKRVKQYITGGVTVYMLYNFKDKPTELWYRLNEINKLKANGYPMRYRDYTVDGREYIGKYWNAGMLRRFTNMLSNFRDGMVGGGCTRDRFHDIFGENPSDFEHNISNEGIFKKGQTVFDTFM